MVCASVISIIGHLQEATVSSTQSSGAACVALRACKYWMLSMFSRCGFAIQQSGRETLYTHACITVSIDSGINRLRDYSVFCLYLLISQEATISSTESSGAPLVLSSACEC